MITAEIKHIALIILCKHYLVTRACVGGGEVRWGGVGVGR